MMDRGYLEEEQVRFGIEAARSNLRNMTLFGLETSSEFQRLRRLEHELLRVQVRRGTKSNEQVVLHFMRDFE